MKKCYPVAQQVTLPHVAMGGLQENPAVSTSPWIHTLLVRSLNLYVMKQIQQCHWRFVDQMEDSWHIDYPEWMRNPSKPNTSVIMIEFGLIMDILNYMIFIYILSRGVSPKRRIPFANTVCTARYTAYRAFPTSGSAPLTIKVSYAVLAKCVILKR
jgi:hypothetical protein